MNLLIILGNAAVDYKFRRLLLQDPLGTAETYGFRLTKFEAQMLEAATTKNVVALEQVFKALEDQLYLNIQNKPVPYLITDPTAVPGMDATVGCHQRPCTWSLTPPSALKDVLAKIA